MSLPLPTHIGFNLSSLEEILNENKNAREAQEESKKKRSGSERFGEGNSSFHMPA